MAKLLGAGAASGTFAGRLITVSGQYAGRIFDLDAALPRPGQITAISALGDGRHADQAPTITHPPRSRRKQRNARQH